MKIHFMGIGGIGVSALAQYYLEKGEEVSGSDLYSSEITESLAKKGAKISIGKHQASEKNPDFVVYSPAVEQDNPELKGYVKKGIKCQSYPQALGNLVKDHFTIAVSGAHGKSTTASMLALTMIEAGLDPTVIVGTKLKEFRNSNFRMGKSKYLVIEACEHEAAFLNYWAKMIVLTNIDREHLDYYKNLRNILKAFKEYLSRLLNGGILIFNEDDPNIRKIARKDILSKGFSLKQKEAKKMKKILQIPGEHNIYNALAVLETSRALGIKDEIAYRALSKYRGSWRRFEEINPGIISDYGHHPNEVKATLQAAREKYKKEKIWCVFQPHQYQRTYYLFKEFVDVFKKARIDRIIITDIYTVPGRETEEIKRKTSSQKLVKRISKKNVIYLPQKGLKEYLSGSKGQFDILIIMGAGDIYNLSSSFK